MDTEMKIENWNGYDIRFVDHNGEWWLSPRMLQML